MIHGFIFIKTYYSDNFCSVKNEYDSKFTHSKFEINFIVSPTFRGRRYFGACLRGSKCTDRTQDVEY